MGLFDKLLGRKNEPVEGQHDNEVTPDEHERHLEQSANPGTAPVVPPDTDTGSADEVEENRSEGTSTEELDETRLRDDQEGRLTREPPRSY